jgi:hypothetical protein
MLPVDVTDDMIANIPPENLRIPREVFGALWRESEHRGERPATTGAGNHYLAGVIGACRWLYAQPIPHPLTPSRRPAPAEAPYTCHWDGVTPETVDAEYLTVLSVGPDRHPHRVQWAAGTAAVLGWTWHGQQRPGLDGPTQAATG